MTLRAFRSQGNPAAEFSQRRDNNADASGGGSQYGHHAACRAEAVVHAEAGGEHAPAQSACQNRSGRRKAPRRRLAGPGRSPAHAGNDTPGTDSPSSLTNTCTLAQNQAIGARIHD